MRFGVFYELQLPRPWNEGDERNLFHQALEQVELADRLGFTAWKTTLMNEVGKKLHAGGL